MRAQGRGEDARGGDGAGGGFRHGAGRAGRAGASDKGAAGWMGSRAHVRAAGVAGVDLQEARGCGAEEGRVAAARLDRVECPGQVLPVEHVHVPFGKQGKRPHLFIPCRT